MGYGERGSIGYVCPSVPLDMIVDEVGKMMPEGVMMVYSTLYIQQLRQEDFDRAIASLDAAVGHMIDGGAECIVVGGGPVVATIGSDEGVVARATELAGVPSQSTTGAMLAGLDSLGAKRVVVATPYPDERNELLKTYLEARGYEVAAMKGLGIQRVAEIARLDFEASYELAVEAAKGAGNVDAFYIPCARFPIVSNIEAIERDTGIPVVASTQATVWWGLRTLGLTDSITGYGRLYDCELAG